MGFMDKIEDKLHKKDNKSSTNTYDDSTTDTSSSLRHPVSSSTANTGADGYNSSSTAPGGYGSSNTGRDGYGSSTTGAHGNDGLHSSKIPGSHGHTGSHGLSSTDRDGYGNSGVGSGRTPGSHNDRDGYGQSGVGAGTIPGSHNHRDGPGNTDVGSGGLTGSRNDGYGNTGGSKLDPREQSGGLGHPGPREPYDPYSSKGQQTAANAASRGDNYGSNTYGNDSNVPRNHDGGIKNHGAPDLYPGSHPNARNEDAIPTAGGQRIGGSDANDPYSSNTTTSHHYTNQPDSRGPLKKAADAVTGKNHDDRYDDRTHDSKFNDHSSSSGLGSGNNHNGNTGFGSSTNPTHGSHGHSGGMTGSSGATSGLSSGPSAGSAYEAGYRDAMEQAKRELGGR